MLRQVIQCNKTLCHASPLNQESSTCEPFYEMMKYQTCTLLVCSSINQISTSDDTFCCTKLTYQNIKHIECVADSKSTFYDIKWKAPRWAWGWSSPWNVIPFLQCSDTVYGWQEGHPACRKNWVLVCWWWRFDWNFACFIAPVVTTTIIILSFNKIQNGDFWYWLTQVHLENGC